MVGCDQEEQFVLKEGRAFHHVGAGRSDDEREIDPPFLQPLGRVAGLGQLEAHLPVRIFPAEPAQDGREEILADAGGGADPETAFGPASELAERLARGRHLVQNFFRVIKEVFSGRSELHGFAQPVQEPTSHIIFQHPHGMADGGLGDE